MLFNIPKSPKTLILIPAYNEEERIGEMLERYLSFFSSITGFQIEFMVILNGCRDRTKNIVQGFQITNPHLKLSEFNDPIGKGGALIEGLKGYKDYDLIGFVDADGSTPPEAFAELLHQIKDFDAVIASRWIEGAKVIHLQTPIRRFASRCFHLIVDTLFLMDIHDTQCGAKVIRTNCVDKIMDELVVADMAFDVNLLYCLHRIKARIKEFPTTWEDKGGSKVRIFMTSTMMLLSIIRLRWIYSPLAFLRPFFMPMETKFYFWIKKL